MKLVDMSQARGDANGVSEILNEAIETGFESVIVFGFKDGKVWITRSKLDNTLELLGALEGAKMHLWEST